MGLEIYKAATAASNNGDYKSAYAQFKELLNIPAWKDDQEVNLRVACLSEKLGHMDDALSFFRDMFKHQTTVHKHPVFTGVDTIVPENSSGIFRVMNDGDKSLILDFYLDGEKSEDASLMTRVFKKGIERKLIANELLCHYDDEAYSMWLLVKGAVVVTPVAGKRFLIKPSGNSPCVLGDMSFYTHQTRSAKLESYGESLVIELPYSLLSRLKDCDEELNGRLNSFFKNRLIFNAISKNSCLTTFPFEDKKLICSTFLEFKLEKGRRISHPEKPLLGLMLVQSGIVLVTEFIDGKEVLVKSLHSGELHGVSSLLFNSEKINRYTMTTVTAASIHILKMSHFEPFIKKNPSIIKAIIESERGCSSPEFDRTQRFMAHQHQSSQPMDVLTSTGRFIAAD